MSDLQPHSCLARVQVWWELPPATVGAWATTLQQTCKQTIKHGLHVCCVPVSVPAQQVEHRHGAGRAAAAAPHLTLLGARQLLNKHHDHWRLSML